MLHFDAGNDRALAKSTDDLGVKLQAEVVKGLRSG